MSAGSAGGLSGIGSVIGSSVAAALRPERNRRPPDVPMPFLVRSYTVSCRSDRLDEEEDMVSERAFIAMDIAMD